MSGRWIPADEILNVTAWTGGSLDQGIQYVWHRAYAAAPETARRWRPLGERGLQQIFRAVRLQKKTGVLRNVGRIIPEIITTLRCGNVRLAY